MYAGQTPLCKCGGPVVIEWDELDWIATHGQWGLLLYMCTIIGR